MTLFNCLGEQELAGACALLGASAVPSVSASEEALLRDAQGGSRLATLTSAAVARGDDLLGQEFAAMRSAAERRDLGATYTPQVVVAAMLDQLPADFEPAEVIDPGAGSGRFLVAAGRRFGSASLVGVEVDPLAALMARAHLSAAGLAGRSRILLSDYRDLRLSQSDGHRLFVGNPPYVRHHQIDPRWKAWLTEQARRLGLGASQLAGLHVHFFLATALLGRPGDRGAFITSAEWLDVNYGSLVRDLLVGPLGGESVVVVEPTVQVFQDAATTAAIAHFEIAKPRTSVCFGRLGKVEDLASPLDLKPVGLERLAGARRWMQFTRPGPEPTAHLIELGELCRVHRGAVTGANRVFIEGDHTRGLPDECLRSTVTRAKELIAAGEELVDASGLRRVVDLPEDLGRLGTDARRGVDRWLAFARGLGADQGFVARHRRAWWAVGLRAPAPILATYMARRPPAFVLNSADASHLNIAHGLYPRTELSQAALRGLASWLNSSTDVSMGRTYAGGLTKFEPGEMERLRVPPIADLERMGSQP